MLNRLPDNIFVFMDWSWAEIEPYYEILAQRPLTAATIADWLADWSALTSRLAEKRARLALAKTLDTGDSVAEAAYNDFLENIFPSWQKAEQVLRQKLLQTGLEPAGLAVPLRKMRTDVALFSEANLPLLTEEQKLNSRYDKAIGAQMVTWEGEALTLTQLGAIANKPDRAIRESAWRLAAERRLEDRAELDVIWQELLALRRQIAANAGYEDYRAYRWELLKRFDYSPEDCRTFHESIEKVVVPAANKIYKVLRQELGVDKLRPWDLRLDIYPLSFPPLHPFQNGQQLQDKAANVFQQVDDEIGGYFDMMCRESLLDLENRKGKAPGAYCTSFPASKRPFIFMNAVGSADDVKTMLHEAGHAFHVFEASQLPYTMQRRTGAEFAEVASMAMELLASPYLETGNGGYFDSEDVAQYRLSHLRKIVAFWPYMAIVDSFQHWVYENHDAALDPANCDAQWKALWQRFVPAVDWSGLDDELVTGWHRKLHIFRYPFYYVEYGLAQLGAVQVWANALKDQATAVSQYRQALALGGTRPLPDLYSAAGARFGFDIPLVSEIVDLLETTMASLSD